MQELSCNPAARVPDFFDLPPAASAISSSLNAVMQQVPWIDELRVLYRRLWRRTRILVLFHSLGSKRLLKGHLTERWQPAFTLARSNPICHRCSKRTCKNQWKPKGMVTVLCLSTMYPWKQPSSLDISLGSLVKASKYPVNQFGDSTVQSHLIEGCITRTCACGRRGYPNSSDAINVFFMVRSSLSFAACYKDPKHA